MQIGGKDKGEAENEAPPGRPAQPAAVSEPMTIVFYIAGAVAIVATALMITRLNAVHALLYLIVSLLAVAVVFYVLGAPFVAALEVIIYAGAIMVLFVFVVMMLNLGKQAAATERALAEARHLDRALDPGGHPDG